MSDNKQVSSLDEAAELLPCPFCGCKEIKIEQFARNGFELKCRSCLIGYKQKTLMHSLNWLKEQMIEAWNTRQSQQKETKPTGFPNAIEANDRLNEIALKANPTVLNGKSEFHLGWRLCYDWLTENQKTNKKRARQATHYNSITEWLESGEAPLPKPVEDKETFSADDKCPYCGELPNENGECLCEASWISNTSKLLHTPKPVSEEGENEFKVGEREANYIRNSEFYKGNQ